MPHPLKRLELVGFKSFAQKTAFDFSSGITAIVGPNGSGKSNIIDAIRWLLGEREAKHLRGGKGEDLIFAGTAKRSRLGQARASLYFDNGSNLFPVEFAEIAVSREVRRDGTNRYFLNGSEVRLKDLVNFFAQARLGSRGLVVITQGNSDIFIRATPFERRGMMEEILGLREYRLKKEEAERRLKNTHINLEKAKALTQEILPHLRSLKRQAGKWERRAEIAGELKDLENQFFGFEHKELRQRMAKVEEEIEAHAKIAVALKSRKEETERSLRGVEGGAPKERRELGTIKTAIQNLLEKRSKLQRELGRIEAQVEMSADVSSAVPETQAFLEFIKKTKGKLEAALEEPENLHYVIGEVLEEIDEFLAEPGRVSSREKTSVSERFSAELEKVKKGLRGVDAELRALEDKEKALEEHQEHFYGEFKEAVASLEAAKDKLEAWEIAHREKMFEKERFALRLEEWERQVRAAGRDPKEFSDVTIERGEERDRVLLERRILRLRGELAAIGEIDESLVREAQDTEKRYEFLSRESEDLAKARKDLEKLTKDLDFKIKTEFERALHRINEEFNTFFNLMFGGGHAKLKVTTPQSSSFMKTEKPLAAAESEEAMARVPEAQEEAASDSPRFAGEAGGGESRSEESERETGIDIDLKLPRKRTTTLDMLSGGERSLVAIAALFSLVSVSPPPFLVLDEVDAALDERNTRRFAEMIKEFSKKIQFVLVTHNRATMEAADVLYGITMNEDETSKVVSLKLEA